MQEKLAEVVAVVLALGVVLLLFLLILLAASRIVEAM